MMNLRPDPSLRRARSATGREQPVIHGENEQSAAEERLQRLERMIEIQAEAQAELQTQIQQQMSTQLQTIQTMMQQVLVPAQAQFPTPEVAATRIKTEVSAPVPSATWNPTPTPMPTTMHAQAQPPAQTIAPVPTQYFGGVPRIADADYFSGERDKLRTFLAKCRYQFRTYPSHFVNEQAKVTYAASGFGGEAFLWYDQLSCEESPLLDNFKGFAEALEARFGNFIPRERAEDLLFTMHQTASVHAFAEEFKSISKHVPWSDMALNAMFRNGLKNEIRHELAKEEFTGTFGDYVSKASTIEQQLLFLRKSQDASQPAARSPPSRPTGVEKQPHRDPRECSFCGKEGHLVGNCFTRLNQLKPSHPSGTPMARNNSARRPRPRVNAASLSAQTVPSDQGKEYAQ
jgi:hypothetical protein